MSPELRLLAACVAPAGVGVTAAARAGPVTDWPLLLRLADRHRVVPGFAAGLDRAGIVPPAAVARTLFQARVAALGQEHALAETAGTVVAELEAAVIRVAVLKGPPLSMAIHDRLGLRTSRDLDLLVAPGDVAPSLRVLARLGFGGGQEKRFPRHKDVELSRGEGRETVELHWRLFDNPHLMPLLPAIDFPRARLSPTLECTVLPPLLELLYLCNHGAQHAWSRLKWLADVAALLDALGSEGRASFYAGTTLADGRRAVGQTLLLCDRLFAMPAPQAVVFEARRDWRIAALARIALHSLASGDVELEARRFGSTRKNVSHYLIRNDRAYLAAEAWFDLNDTSMVTKRSQWRHLGAVGRLGAWAGHKLGGR